MELRQLRYFVCVVELGSVGRAAADLGVVTSALSQQISRPESDLATRLLSRTANCVVPTDAGLAFLRQAQLQRLSGRVSVGLAPTAGAVLGLPPMQAMRERHPAVRLQLVESLSGHLTDLLNAPAGTGRAVPQRRGAWPERGAAAAGAAVPDRRAGAAGTGGAEGLGPRATGYGELTASCHWSATGTGRWRSRGSLGRPRNVRFAA